MTTIRWFVWVGVLLAAASARAQGSRERIEAARQLVAAGKFKEALAEAEALGRQPGNDRATVVAAYELSGLAYGGLKQVPKAKLAFQRLLTLEPNFKLKGKVPPKAAAAFKEAKKWVAQRGGGLKAEQLTPEIKDGKVSSVYMSVEGDVTALVKTARVHLRLDAAPWTVKDVPVRPTTTVEAGGKAVQWWVEFLGDNDAVLLTLGSQEEPFVDAVPGAVVPKPVGVAKKDEPKKKEPKKEEPKKVEANKEEPRKADVAMADAPVAETKPPLVPQEKAEPAPDLQAKAPKGSGPRILPWALMGAGVVSVSVGMYFGIASNGARTQIATAATDPNSGLVTGISRAQALELQQRAQTDAVVANALFGVGAGLVVGGVVAWLVGGN
jgi:hypothetical protein